MLVGVAALQAAWMGYTLCSQGVALGYICSSPPDWDANYFRLVQFEWFWSDVAYVLEGFWRKVAYVLERK